jgi:acyl carrier protein
MQTTPDGLRERIQRFLRDEQGIDEPLGADAALISSGLVDSVGLMRLAAFLEDETGAAIPDQDLTVEHFDTIRRIEAYLGRPAAD